MSELKHIAIVELESHNEVLRAYLLVLLELNFKILCLTTPFNFKQLNDLHRNDKIQFVLKEKDISYEAYFSNNKELLSICSGVVVTTIPLRNPFFKTFIFPCKSIFVVHKYHSYFDPSNNLKLSGLKDIGRLIKGKMAGYSNTYKQSISNFSAIVMPSDISYTYAKSKNNHGENKLIGSLDFAINELASLAQNNATIQIVIPGTIGSKSRDYLTFVEAIRSIKDKLSTKIEFHLLGRPMGSYGEKIITLCQSLESEHITFSFYRDFIIQSAFDKIMLKADFLILPIAEYMKFDIYNEKNGYSCVSGNINDLLKYGLPSILPSYYPIDKELEEMVARYGSSDELGKTILEWIEAKKYNHIKEKSTAVLRQYGVKQMSKKFEQILNKSELD